MKKYLSVLLAVLMMFAVCVPAFAAADQTEVTDEDGSPKDTVVQVYTDIEDVTSEYTVTIPADLAVAWNDTDSHEMPYTVDSTLLMGATLSVSVAANDGGKMSLETDDGESYLYFTLSNGAASTFTGYNEGAEPTTQPSVAVNDFEQAIAVYTGSLTYTVTYTAPSAP